MDSRNKKIFRAVFLGSLAVGGILLFLDSLNPLWLLFMIPMVFLLDGYYHQRRRIKIKIKEYNKIKESDFDGFEKNFPDNK